MNLRMLWQFLAAASAGGVSAGARRLGVAQSTISAAVAGLESSAGARLLAPTPVGARLTPDGVRLRDYGLWLALEIEQAFLDLRAGRVGRIDPTPVELRGVPRNCRLEAAVIAGLFANAARGGRRAMLVRAAPGEAERATPDGLVLRYRLTAPHAPTPPCVRSRSLDPWVLVALRESVEDQVDVEWRSLESLSARVAAMTPGLSESIMEASGLRLEPVAPDPTGAVFGLLDRSVPALLMPRSWLPSGATLAGLSVRAVSDAPLVPALDVEMPGSDGGGAASLAAALSQELRSLAERPDPPPPRCRP